MMKTTQAQVVRHESMLKARLEQKQAELEANRASLLIDSSVTEEEWILCYDEQSVIDFVREVFKALSGKWAKSMEFVASQFGDDTLNEADAWMQSWIREA
jgi:inorganic pyrophosphatase/exopolyphosphatase